MSCAAATLVVGYVAYSHAARTGALPSALTLGNAVFVLSSLASDVLFCCAYESWLGWTVLCLNALASTALLVKLLSELEIALDEVGSSTRENYPDKKRTVAHTDWACTPRRT